MSAKRQAKAADKVKICKHDSCFGAAQVKGFCRLHFLKVLSGQGQGDSKPIGKLKDVKPKVD